MKAGLGASDLLRKHFLLAAMIAVYAGLATWLSTTTGSDVSARKAGTLFKSFAIKVPQMIFFVLLWRLLVLTYQQKVDDRIGVLKSEVKGFIGERDRMLFGFMTAGLMTIMLISFAQLKNLIPILNPFSWDVFFMELDRALHFGVPPHELAHALFGWHYSISFFTGIYNVWLFLMYFLLLIACFMRPESPVRMQYLVAFVLTWFVGGNILATTFSSAGPVYYNILGFGNAYSELMGWLYSHANTGALTVVNTQEVLWRLHTVDKSINAISAFPSMHVTSSVLMAIFAFRASYWLGIAMSVFAVGIMIGSVLLAWHYAVDGYIGAIVAILSWKVAGWLVKGPFGPFAAKA